MLHYSTRGATAAAVLLMFTGAAEAKPCRDATGKFIACHAPAPAPSAHCRSASGQFAKCPAPASATAAARIGTAANTAAVAPQVGTVTARCRDGSLSASQHRSGTCASHGGVATWLQQR